MPILVYGGIAHVLVEMSFFFNFQHQNDLDNGTEAESMYALYAWYINMPGVFFLHCLIFLNDNVCML